jgi:hypothetical protein
MRRVTGPGIISYQLILQTADQPPLYISILSFSRPCLSLSQILSRIPDNGAECTVDGMKLHREKYSGDFIPHNLPEFFQGSEKLEKFTRASNRTITKTAYH